MALSSLGNSATPTHQRWHPDFGVVTGIRQNSDLGRQEQKKYVEMPQEVIADGTETRVNTSSKDHGQKIDEHRVSLPYILECLDVIKAFAESRKKEAKSRMMVVGDAKDLEELMATLDQHRCDDVYCRLHQWSDKSSSKLLKKTIGLRKKLSPSSKFHERRSVSDLQQAVLEVKAVVESLEDIPWSDKTRNQIKERWNEGCGLISEK